MRVLVMGGAGAVGSAIAKAYSAVADVAVLDPEAPKPPTDTYEFLHVAIPWQDWFVQKVQQVAATYGASYVIIHSTVPIGTTRKIAQVACHSPVLGQHDDLESSVYRFTKWFGPVQGEYSRDFHAHLSAAGFRPREMGCAEETEFSKLACLSRFFHDLAFYEAIDKAARDFRINGNFFREWTKEYNDGYQGTKFVRPDLDFPGGRVGGHCVRQGAKLFLDQTEAEILRADFEIFANGGIHGVKENGTRAEARGEARAETNPGSETIREGIHLRAY